ncbi:cupin domain-containing protein [Arthrobacter cavernae]|uniref:Ethanolamine utilization protein n=1 Tax=Arthrobacter cavernae TaxID=2817681 RepID=A0A939HGX9_9MICC|nr:ethanolamine utilization protein [Arthrobacter cavernae]MBO1267275.1 ethanolamine utilization protein [Arthrobacter cavernae]
MDSTLMGTLSTAGAIQKVESGYLGLPGMDVPGSEAFIGDSLANPGGSAMCAGFFELKKSEPLVYEYTYDEMKIVVQGEFILTDMASGETTVAKERDILFFPQGTTVKFETPDHAVGFFVGDRTFAP